MRINGCINFFYFRFVFILYPHQLACYNNFSTQLKPTTPHLNSTTHTPNLHFFPSNLPTPHHRGGGETAEKALAHITGLPVPRREERQAGVSGEHCRTPQHPRQVGGQTLLQRGHFTLPTGGGMVRVLGNFVGNGWNLRGRRSSWCGVSITNQPLNQSFYHSTHHSTHHSGPTNHSPTQQPHHNQHRHHHHPGSQGVVHVRGDDGRRVGVVRQGLRHSRGDGGGGRGRWVDQGSVVGDWLFWSLSTCLLRTVCRN